MKNNTQQSIYQHYIGIKTQVLDTITNSIGQSIEYIENPENGDGMVIAIFHDGKVASETAFFETDDFFLGSDYEYQFKGNEFKCSYEF